MTTAMLPRRSEPIRADPIAPYSRRPAATYAREQIERLAALTALIARLEAVKASTARVNPSLAAH
jgi:hypothetical protein